MEKMIQRNMDDLKGFSQTMLEENLVPSITILNKYVREAGNLYASLFRIKPEEHLFYIRRLCLANKEPISLEEIYIPKYLVPKLSGIDLNMFSIYEIYEMFGVHLVRAEETLDLVIPNAADAKLLKMEAQTPALFFQSTSYDDKGRVVEFNKNYVRGNRCSFKVHFLNHKQDGD
ncbi:MAG: GntR family transcriptional regulator [Lachnospiraceae bacterium]|nr:GntR family transcriptional regulator [Lachnospiraceae bacterium]